MTSVRDPSDDGDSGHVFVGVWFRSSAWGGFWQEAIYRIAAAGLRALGPHIAKDPHWHGYSLWTGTSLRGRQADQFPGVRPEGCFLEVPGADVASALIDELAEFPGLLYRGIHSDHPSQDGLTRSRYVFEGFLLETDEVWSPGWRQEPGVVVLAQSVDDPNAVQDAFAMLTTADEDADIHTIGLSPEDRAQDRIARLLEFIGLRREQLKDAGISVPPSHIFH